MKKVYNLRARPDWPALFATICANTWNFRVDSYQTAIKEEPDYDLDCLQFHQHCFSQSWTSSKFWLMPFIIGIPIFFISMEGAEACIVHNSEVINDF